MAANKIRNTRRVKRSRKVKRTRGRRGGYRTNMTYDDEKAYFGNLVQRFKDAQLEEDEIEALDAMARFILHSQHLVEYPSFRRVSIDKLLSLIEYPGAPTYAIRHAQEALARVQAYSNDSSNNSNSSNSA